MADISTTNKKARVPILGENGRISDAYLPQAVIDAEASSKTYAENAKSYSELVKKDAESAASSAASAKVSADAAREGISSIDEKVTNAGQFAEAASSSATEANSYLKQVTAVSDTVSGIASSVAENAQTSETFANKSKESAASALTASTNAVNAKVDAEGYRDSAKSYSDNAKADADTAKNILESVKTQKADVDSTVQQFNTDATEYDTKFNGYVSEAKESKEASAASAASASESAENASTSAANASASADKAKTSADAAALSATNAANSAKEAADNLSLFGASTLTRKEKDTFIHVDDAFPSTLLGIEIEGATEQVTTTGKNLVDAYNKDNERGYLTADGSLKNDGKNEYHVSDYVPIEPSTTYFITMSRTTYTSAPAVCEYDSGKTFVAGHSNLAMGAAFTTASNAAFVRVSCKTNEPGVVQLEKGSIQTSYEPYSGGKPSPSPDYPQEIKVVENPVVNVTGRNLFDISKLVVNDSAPYGLSISVEDGFIIIQGTVSGVGNEIMTPSFKLGEYADNYLSGKGLNISIFGAPSNVRVYGLRTADEKHIAILTSLRDGDKVNWTIQIMVSKGESKEYKPYTLQEQVFTLPAGHPYLAKLQGGTADEIMVDKEGNVELVARVGKLDTTGIRVADEIVALPNGRTNYQYKSFVIPPAAAASVAITPNFKPVVDYAFNEEGCYVSGKTLFVGTQSDPTEVIRASGYLYYVLATPVVYTLGKIEMPKAQDNIMNMWTNAEVTPVTGAEYVRDANIVVSNLEEAIASITQG